jgi:GTP-binding protein HflX
MNRLTEAGVLVEDKLFATLDTRTRRWQLPSWGPVLLSDTVGFIRDLPHRLIASFKATLEEARQADLLLHVADASSPSVFQQINSVYQVLEELGFEAKDMLLAVNKADAADEGVVGVILNRYPNAVALSAKTGEGIDDLAHAVSDALSRGFLDLDIETGVENGRLQAYCAANGEVLSKRFDGDRVIIHCRMPRKFAGRISAEEAEVREHVPVTEPDEEADDRMDDVA